MSLTASPDFAPLQLNTHTHPSGHSIQTGRLPEKFLLSPAEFDRLWQMHPESFEKFKIFGAEKEVPRWQRVFGADYLYPGQASLALPLPENLAPVTNWVLRAVDTRFNSVSVNWYDGALGHYIGPHQDKDVGILPGAPIVTISFGEERVFRVTQKGSREKLDILVTNGTVLILPPETNENCKHEVLKSPKYSSKRISLTFRAFKEGGESFAFGIGDLMKLL